MRGQEPRCGQGQVLCPDAAIGEIHPFIQDFRDPLTAFAIDVIGGTPTEFSIHLKNEMAKWAKVIKDANIRAD